VNESKETSNLGEKWLYFIDVCMSLQGPNAMFTQSGLSGVPILFSYILGKEELVSLHICFVGVRYT
jgi:hypothetical protein